MYLGDSDDNFPLTRYSTDPTGNGYQTANYKMSLYPYMKSPQVFRDPTNPAAVLPDCEGDPTCIAGGVLVPGQPIFSRGYFYYRAFMVTGNWQNAANYNESAIQRPSDSILLGENKDIYADYGPWEQYIVAGTNGWAWSNWGGGHRDDHSMTVDFIDGHAKFEPLEATCGPITALTENQWQYVRGTVNTQTYGFAGGGTLPWLDTFCSSLPF